MTNTPVLVHCDGDCLIPLDRHRALFDKQYEAGKVYAVIVADDHSSASHRQLMAVMRDAWMNLPENLQPLFPNPEILRKHLLIANGFCDVRPIECASHDEALRQAAYLRTRDDYSEVEIAGSTVFERRAKTMRRHAMDHATFQAAKQMIIENAAALIGVSADELMENGGRAA